MKNNLELWEKVRAVPKMVQKPITGGRLKGFTDINPMWRLKVLTETFGPVGKGWYYEITKQEIVEGGCGEKVAFVNINLYVNYEGEWSKPIQGTGGSSFITNERNGLYTSDECYKMALTDAISVACKALGVAADVYFANDRSKYTVADDTKTTTEGQNRTTEMSSIQRGTNTPPLEEKRVTEEIRCSDCKALINQAVKTYSEKYYGRGLCRDCQNKAKKL